MRTMRTNLRAAALVFVAVAALAMPFRPALACSVCLAGDPIYDAEGASAQEKGEINAYFEVRGWTKRSGALVHHGAEEPPPGGEETGGAEGAGAEEERKQGRGESRRKETSRPIGRTGFPPATPFPKQRTGLKGGGPWFRSPTDGPRRRRAV